MDILFSLIGSLLYVILIFGPIYYLFRYLKKQEGVIKWTSNLTDYTFVTKSLIGLVGIGFFTNLDYTQQFGCLVSNDDILSKPNILYSGIAFLFLTLTLLIQSKPIKTILLASELLFWLYKLFFVKEGYSVGFAAAPSFAVLIFDSISLLMRLTIIKQIWKPKFQTKKVLFIAFVTIFIKVAFFS